MKQQFIQFDMGYCARITLVLKTTLDSLVSKRRI